MAMQPPEPVFKGQRNVARVMATLRTHTHSSIITHSARAISDEQATELMKNSASIFGQAPGQDYPRHHQSCLALAPIKQAVSTGRPRNNKLAVLTALNGIVPRQGHFRTVAPVSTAEADLVRILCQKEHRVMGIAMHEVSGDLLKGTGPKGSLSMNALIISGAATVQSFSYSREPLIPGMHVRMVFPSLSEKEKKFTDPPIKYKACPGAIFPELQIVTAGTPEQGNEIVANALATIYLKGYRAVFTQHSGLIPAELTALSRLIFETPHQQVFRRIFYQCQQIVESGNKYFPFTVRQDRPALYRVGDELHLVVVNPADDMQPKEAGENVRFGEAHVADFDAAGGLLARDEDGAMVQRNGPVENALFIYRRYFGHDNPAQFAISDVVIVQKNGADEWVPFDAQHQWPSLFGQNQYPSWGHPTATAQADAIYFCYNLLHHMALHNKRLPGAQLRFAANTPATRELRPCEDITWRMMADWMGSIVTEATVMCEEINSKVVGKVLEDNNDGSVYLALGKHH